MKYVWLSGEFGHRVLRLHSTVYELLGTYPLNLNICEDLSTTVRNSGCVPSFATPGPPRILLASFLVLLYIRFRMVRSSNLGLEVVNITLPLGTACVILGLRSSNARCSMIALHTFSPRDVRDWGVQCCPNFPWGRIWHFLLTHVFGLLFPLE